MVSFFDECDHEFDLTSHCSQGGSIRMIRDGNNACCDVSMSACKIGCKHCHHVYCEEFDISSTDFDDDSTEAPWLYDISANHVRMVADDSLGMDDIVLDSGADVSALPMSFASVGTACAHDGSLFVDAQGNPLEVDSTRLARVRLGDVVFKEKFIVSGVTTPLLSLGNVLRGGWSIHNDGDSQWLTKDELWIPLFLKRNSLCAKGCIQLIQDIQSTPVDESPQAVRAIHLSEPLQTMRPGWNRINDELFAMRTFTRNFIDSTLAPSPVLMWYRTTLAKVSSQWQVVEFAVHVSQINDLECNMLIPGVTEVLTLAHSRVDSYASLGFFEVYDDLPMPGRASGSGSSQGQQPLQQSASDVVAARQPDVPAAGNVSGSNGYDPPNVGDSGAPAPVASGDAEAIEVDAQEASDAFTVAVDGVSLDSSFPLAVIRQACTSLGLARSGGKATCLQRLKKHLESQQLVAQHSAEIQLRADEERVASSPVVPVEPSDEVRAQHALTHQPFASWCEVCVSNRGRQDSRMPRPVPSSGSSVLSFDFGFLNRLDDDDPKLTALFICDQFTKLVHVVPTPNKGGRYLSYLTTELCRFVMYTQHKSIILRTDSEPATLALLDSARKTLTSFGIACAVETAPVGSHQSNGAAEKTVHLVRQLGNCFTRQLEKNGGSDHPVFKALHPLTAWSLIHAAWVRNHYVVQEGQTAFERAFDRMYHGKICSFGEVVLGFVKTSKKGAPSWRKGVWLTKSINNDVHVVAFGEHVFCTRSIRRLPQQWDLKLAGDVTAEPWNFGLASLENKLLSSKRLLPPQVYPVGNVGTPDEAASDPDSVHDEVPVMIPDSMTLDELARRAPTTRHEDEAGQALRPGPADPSSGVVEKADAPMNDPSLSSSGVVRDVDTPREESGRATKVPRLDAPDQQMMLVSQDVKVVNSVCQILALDHEDEPNPTHFEQGELDDLENYDAALELEDNDALDSSIDDASISDMVDRLCRPYGSQEPDIPSDELAVLDALADQVEIIRLKGLGVLLPVSSLPGGEVKRLTTRFVRTWRDKVINNERKWLRRSRYVAREFAWLSSDRQDLFSPASSNITNRLLQYAYLQRKSNDASQVMAALDIGDAFLTVDQVQPTVVSCELASGETEEYALGKVLPGQRDGSLLWYKSLTNFLSEHLQMQPLALYPCLLKSPDSKCLMLLHVDDILVVCGKDYLEDSLLQALNSKYKVCAEVMQFLGDSVTFLKRRLVLEDFDKMIIYPHPKHFTRLFDLVGIKRTWKPKNVPAHSQTSECFETPELATDRASAFRSAVGILLYLSCDMVECQWTIRHLAQSMSKPTEKAWIELRHLVQYLLGCMSHGLLMHYKSDYDGSDLSLKVFTNSDWATNKGTRKSVSSCCIMANNCLLHSASRNQGLIALSSAEAETYAGTSGACDGLFLAKCLEFLLEVSVMPKLLIVTVLADISLADLDVAVFVILALVFFGFNRRLKDESFLWAQLHQQKTFQT